MLDGGNGGSNNAGVTPVETPMTTNCSPTAFVNSSSSSNRRNFIKASTVATAAAITFPSILHGAPLGAAQRVEQVVTAAGGEEKLLKIFRFRERVLITDTPAAPVTADEKGNRTSVVQVGGDWWLGTEKRGKDKVRVLCWAWSLRLLLDPKSKIEGLADSTVYGQPVFGMRVSESVKEPIDLYFDKVEKRLLCIDYADTRHVFSAWKQTKDGHNYPTHVVGYRFVDRTKGTLNEKQWYQTDILELLPLKELPVELRP